MISCALDLSFYGKSQEKCNSDEHAVTTTAATATATASLTTDNDHVDIEAVVSAELSYSNSSSLDDTFEFIRHRNAPKPGKTAVGENLLHSLEFAQLPIDLNDSLSVDQPDESLRVTVPEHDTSLHISDLEGEAVFFTFDSFIHSIACRREYRSISSRLWNTTRS